MAQLQSTSITGSLIVTGGITGSFSGSITAPGSNTQVLFNNSGVISANSGLVYSGGSVGIGTASPARKLDIVQGGPQIRISDGTTNTYWEFYSVFFQSNQDLLIQNQNGNAVTINSGGSVGIGTTNPGYKLDVNGSLNVGANVYNSIGGNKAFAGNGSSQLYFYTGTTALTVRNNADNATLVTITDGGKLGIGNTSPNGILSFADDVVTRKIVMWDGSADNDYQFYGFGVESSTMIQSIYASGDRFLWVAGTGTTTRNELMVLQGDGKLGIGTTSPSYKLHVYDTSSGNARILVQGTSNYTLLQTTNSGGTVFIGIDNSAGSGFGTGAYSRVFYSDGAYPLVISTNGTEKMRITSGGNVGIGNTDPAVKLSVSGVTSTGNRRLSLGILDLNDGGTPTQIRINTTIPFNSPSADFTVNIKGFRYGAPQMVSLSIGWHYYLGSFYNETAISNGAWKPTISLAQDASGYVVIHLSSPSYWPKLYVESVYSSAYGDTYSSGWTWTDADLSNCTNVEVVPYQALATDITGNAGSTSAVSGTTNYVSKFTSATAIGNSLMYDDGVNVGIGTTSPSSQMSGTNGLAISHANYPSVGWNNNTTSWLWYGAGNTLRLWNVSSYEILTATDSGRIGIGTTSPNAKLEVAASTSDGIILRTTSNAEPFIALQRNSASNGVGVFRLQDGGALYFDNGATGAAQSTKMTITGAGYVGIGTTSPGTKLEVAGPLGGTVGVGGSTLRLVNTDTGNYASITAGITGLTNDGMQFSTDGTARMIIASGGNVGIGTTSPNAKLHIAANALGTSAGDYVLNSIHYNSNGNSEELEIKSVRESAGNDWTYGGKRIQLRIDSTYMGYMQFNGYGNNAGISFGTGTTTSAPGNVAERMRITSAGRIGIGTTSPSTTVHISAGDSSYTLYGPNSTWGAYLTVGAGPSAIANGTCQVISTNGNLHLDSGTSQQTYINAYSGTNTLINPDVNGSVGIGTYSPTGRLTVTKGAQSDTVAIGNSAVYAYGSDVGLAIGQYASAPYGTWLQSIRTDNTTFPLLLNPAGSNVGIGTSSPGARLDIRSLASSGATNAPTFKAFAYDTDSYFQVNNNSNNSANITLTRSDSATMFSVDGHSGTTYFAGDVGVGTTSPSPLLSATERVIEISNSNVASLYLDSTTGRKWSVSSISTGQLTFWDLDAVAERMRIATTGNVLIGTTSDAGYKLRVNGSSYFDSPILCYTGNGYITALTNDGVGSNNGFGYSFLINNNGHEIGRLTGIYETSGGGGSGGIGFWTRGSGTLSNKMILNSGGTLTLNSYGSGTKTGTVAYNLAVDSSGNVIETAGGVVDGSGTANYIPKWQDANTLTNSVMYDDGTNIGIGTTTPGAKLEVNGSFRATTKSFIIDHPTKEGKKLQYGVLEGPEHSVYVRGKLTNTHRIELPDYWHALVDEDTITVNLTAIGRKQELWVEEITDKYIMVGSETAIVNCFYTVFAERKDVEKLVTEFDKE